MKKKTSGDLIQKNCSASLVTVSNPNGKNKIKIRNQFKTEIEDRKCKKIQKYAEFNFIFFSLLTEKMQKRCSFVNLCFKETWRKKKLLEGCAGKKELKKEKKDKIMYLFYAFLLAFLNIFFHFL